MRVEGHVRPVPELTPTGLKMYSVTRVLSPYFDEAISEEQIPEFFIKRAQERGTLVHRFCGAYALKLFVPDLPEAYQGYGSSFAPWLDQYVEEVVFAERRLYDYDLGFLGHPDLFCKLIGQSFYSLFDIKTPTTKHTVWKLQLSAYTHLCRKNGFNPGWVGSIQLDRDGGWPTISKHEYAERDIGVFLGLLQARRYLDS